MVKMTIYMDDEVALTLRQLAVTERRPQAEIIREAILAYTKSAGRRPKGIGAYKSGRTDISERAEELMRRAARMRLWRSISSRA
jgi:predicted transcriptional regulator